MKFNLSYSSLSLYEESPLTFYFQYVLKIPAPDEVNQVYGLAGNIVHKALEYYIKGVPFNAVEKWKEKGLDHKKGLNEKPLPLPEYLKCIEYGKKQIDMYRTMGYRFITELEVKFPYTEVPGVTIKGFIDLVAVKDDKVVFIDYKTDSPNSYYKGKHKKQRLFYAWMYYRKYKIVPDLCKWIYLKLSKTDEDKFTLKNIMEFDTYIKETVSDIYIKGMKRENYEEGDMSSIFNGYKSLVKQMEPIQVQIQANEIYMPNITEKLANEINDIYKYELKNSYFIVKAMAKKGVMMSPYKMFYSFHRKTLPIGFLNSLWEFFMEREIPIDVIDKRVPLKEYPMPDKLNFFPLKDYQEGAVNKILKRKIGFLQIATSGGKTAIAAEIIRRTKGLSLFVIDRNLLLTQTKKEFETMLCRKIGTMTEGKVDLEVVNVATIQTLVSLIKKKDKDIFKILSNIKTLIIDEGHTVSTKSFLLLSKYVTNAQYRIGMSGTFDRPDGNSMIIESIVGRIEYDIPASTLIKNGHIMKPKISFLKLNNTTMPVGNYHEIYQTGVVENWIRNETIIKVAKSEKTKLILVSRISHGEYLKEKIPGSVFINGSIDETTREKWIQEIKDNEINTIIGTVSIIQKGLNITNLEMIINATGNISSITTIQSLGRILRKHEGKAQPHYIDFYDEGKFLKEHSIERIRVLEEQGHEVKTLTYNKTYK